MSAAARRLRMARENVGVIVAVCGVALPIGLAMSIAGIGIPLVGYALHRLLSALVARDADVVETEARRKAATRSGAYATLGLVLIIATIVAARAVGASTAGSAAGDEPERLEQILAWVSAMIAPAVVGGLLSPLAFTAFAATEVGRKTSDVVESFELSAYLGLRRTAWLGALAGGLYGVANGLTYFVLSFFSFSDPWLLGLFALPVGAMTGVPLAAIVLADGYREARKARRAASVDGAARKQAVSAPIKALIGFSTPVLLVLVGAIGLAAFTPTAMRDRYDSPVRGFFEEDVAVGERVRVEDTAVFIRVVEEGIVIETDDGGGAGLAPTPFTIVRSARIRIEPIDGHYVVCVAAAGLAETVIDADGVRLDDSLDDRVGGRLGTLGTLAIAAGALAFALLAFVTGRSLGRARTLAAPAFDEKQVRGQVFAMQGILRFAEDTRGWFRPSPWLRGKVRGRLWVDGPAWIETDDGEHRFQLSTRPVAVLGAAVTDGWDHTTVTVLSRFDRIEHASFRDAAASLPDDARLVFGHPEDAERELTREAIRTGARFAALAITAFAVADVILILALRSG